MPFPLLAKGLTPAPWFALLLLGSGPAYAQAPTLTGLSPVRNAVAVPRASNVALTFSQAISAASAGNVRVFSAQRGGQLNRPGSGTMSGGGTNTVTFDPATDFKPGETVSVTVPSTVLGAGGQAAPPRVYQFTTAVGGTGTGTFVAPATTPEVSVGNNPVSVAVGDVDGDGDLDLVSVNSRYSGTLSVRLNNGNGIFSGGSDVSVGIYPRKVVMGDVDNDGDLDLFCGNSGINSNSVSIRFNNGNGIFSGTQDIVVGTSPADIVVADVDGDGDLDLLCSNSPTHLWSASAWFNDGTGFFNFTRNINLGRLSNYCVAVGDVDGDGDLDLLTASGPGTTDDVQVWRNNGGGIFSSTPNIITVPDVASWELGDIDGDGDLDLLILSGPYFGRLNVKFNDGNGVFSGSQEVMLRQDPKKIALGDIDNDGDLDLLIVNSYSSVSNVSVWLNDGAGFFNRTTDVSVGTSPEGAALGDVDGDGDLDLLTANYSLYGTVSVRLNGPAPMNTPAAVTPTPFTLAPNPATTNGAVRITGIPAHQPLTLLDATGRRVATLPADATGAATLRPDALAPGLYLLRAADGRTRRLVVE